MTNSTLKREILLALAEAEEAASHNHYATVNLVSASDQSKLIAWAFIDNCSTKAAKLREIASRIQDEQQRFIMPTSEQLINFAIAVNDGKFDKQKISEMLAYANLILDRMYENGDITKPTSKEIQDEQEQGVPEKSTCKCGQNALPFNATITIEKCARCGHQC